MTLVYVAIAWTLGLMAGATLAPPLPVIGLAAGWAVGGLALERGHPRNRRFAALALVAVLGAWRWHLAQPRCGPHDLATYNDRGAVVVEGHISAEPQIRSTRVQIQVSVDRLTLGGQAFAVRGELLASVPLYPAYQYGDRLRCSGKLETPPVLEDFDYREYLASQGVHSLMRWAQVERLPGRGGSLVLRALYGAKAALRQRIDRILPHPEAGLLQGILLGLDHTLPADLADAFRIAGLTHIIVISGYNVSVLLEAWFLGIRRWMHRWLGLGAGLVLLGLFVAFVGPSPPVVRAGLTGGLFVIAQLLGRRASPLASLAAAALIMTAINPLLLHSVSYQLSIASTLALLLLHPRLAEGLHGWLGAGDPGWMRILWEVSLTTIAAQLATLPIIWANFGELSTVALLANLLVLPIQPLILIPGAIVVLVALPAPGLARLLGYALWLPLRWCTGVARTLSSLPWAALSVPKLPSWAAWLFYAALMLLVWARPSRRARPAAGEAIAWRPWAVGGFLLVTAALIWGAVATLPDGKLHIYALDVGQGDALLIRSPQGHLALIDGGPDPVLMSARLGQILPFWQRYIDLILVTHEDSDHLAGLVPLVERYQVGHIAQGSSAGASLLSAAWQQRLEAGEFGQWRVQRGDRILLGEVCLHVLHPADDLAYHAPDDNERSVVILLEYGAFRMLFAGDIGAQAESELLRARQDLSATALKVSHHGSASGSTAGFLARVAPQVALISVGAENRFGHPSPEVLQRLEGSQARVLRTDERGTIELVTDGRQLWIKTDR